MKNRINNKIYIIIGILSLSIGLFFIGTGFYKKDNYYRSEHMDNLNKNSYVGGDAYNYIINASYFTGYTITGTIFVGFGTLFSLMPRIIKDLKYK